MTKRDSSFSIYVNKCPFTVMASMENKGESIAFWYQKNGRYTMEMIFRVIQETLFAVREVHLAGYLHFGPAGGQYFCDRTADG